MQDGNEFFSNQVQELRRGTIVVATLSLLQTPKYGYALLQSLETAGIVVDIGTLYPLLRRLEKQGILESDWDTKDTRPRKYYRLSTLGREAYKRITAEWVSMSTKLDHIVRKEQ
jgi:DNA-binding PadR family transcriptional regulator